MNQTPNYSTKLENAINAVKELASNYENDAYVNEEFNQGLQVAFRLVLDTIDREIQ